MYAATNAALRPHRPPDVRRRALHARDRRRSPSLLATTSRLVPRPSGTSTGLKRSWCPGARAVRRPPPRSARSSPRAATAPRTRSRLSLSAPRPSSSCAPPRRCTSSTTRPHASPRPPRSRGASTVVVLSDGSEMANFARGVCSSCSEDGRAQLCVGTANGTVLVMEYDGARFRDAASLDGHYQVPVADLASEVDSFRRVRAPDSAGPRRGSPARTTPACGDVARHLLGSFRGDVLGTARRPRRRRRRERNQVVAAETSGRSLFHQPHDAKGVLRDAGARTTSPR